MSHEGHEGGFGRPFLVGLAQNPSLGTFAGFMGKGLIQEGISEAHENYVFG